MHRDIYLQLFAEGDTNPDEKKEANLENKPEEKKESALGSKIRGAFGLPEKKPAQKEPDKKPEDKPEEKPEEKKDVVPEDKQEDKPEDKKDELEFDEITYNKEKVKIPITERQTYLQKGYNYDKVKQQADEYKSALLRAANLAGFKTTEEYLADLEMKQKAKIAEQIEEAAGDPAKIDEIVKNHPEILKTQEERRKVDEEKRIIEFNKALDELKKDRFYKDLEPQLKEMAELNPTVDPRLLYKVIRSDYLTPEKLEELMAKEKEATKKSVMADIHDKEKRAAPIGGDASDDKTEIVKPTAFGSKLANAFGFNASQAQRAAQRAHERLKQRS